MKILSKYEYFEDYLKYMIEHDMTRNYKDNLSFSSVVDEAWCWLILLQMDLVATKLLAGASRWDRRCTYIIRESQVWVIFFTDGKQSFRDNESTKIEDMQGKMG